MNRAIVQVIDRETVVVEIPADSSFVLETPNPQTPHILETPVGPRGPEGPAGQPGPQGPQSVIEWETTQW